MAELNNQITFCTYNANNYNAAKYEITKDLFNKCDFLLLQETWLTEKEFIRKFKNDFPNSECISSSQMDLDEIKPGRPYGGVAICYHTKLKCIVENIPTKLKSICAIKISIGNLSILLVNTYMPCSEKSDAIAKYSEILREIGSLCMKSSTQYLILGGDYNADPSRNDMRTQLFRNFITQEKT